MEALARVEHTEDMPQNITQTHNNNAVVTYTNASLLQITDDEQKKLQEPVDPNEVEIRPDGLLYLPQVFVRDKLNKAFGIGQWALLQHAVSQIDNILAFDGSLYIRGAFVARAMGEAKYYASNESQSWASVYESAKSDCLVRCCKDLGIAKELWQPAFGRKWQAEYAVKVWRTKAKNNAGAYQWRRKDVEPFYDEKGQEQKQEQTRNTPGAGATSTPEPLLQVDGSSTVSPGDFVTNFGRTAKGKKISELSTEQIRKGIAYCQAEGKEQEWVKNALAYLNGLEKDPGMTLDDSEEFRVCRELVELCSTPESLKELESRVAQAGFDKKLTPTEIDRLYAIIDGKKVKP